MRSAAIFHILAAAMAGSALAHSDGTEAYERACADCHRSAERLVRRLNNNDGERRQRLESFLADHHAPDNATRSAIIDYLLGL